ncbi:MAG: creatininase family protein, partial [Alphaproteobacteria bacterium]
MGEADRDPAAARIADIPWTEAARRLAGGRPLLLPIGAAAKAHGPHLPLGTDRIVVEAIADR